jgi:hypothetical protein
MVTFCLPISVFGPKVQCDDNPYKQIDSSKLFTIIDSTTKSKAPDKGDECSSKTRHET